MIREPGVPDELLDYLGRTTRLSRDEAAGVVAEVLAYFSEQPRDFVARRHRELQREGLGNPAIFEQIGRELAARRFASAPLSSRQLRRLVYG